MSEEPEDPVVAAPPADDVPAGGDAADSKEAKKKKKLEERANELRRKAREEAKQKAAARKAKDDAADDDGAPDVAMSEHHTALLAKLKALPKTGRAQDSLPALADGMARRLTQTEVDLARRQCEGKSDEDLAATYVRFAGDKSVVADALDSLRAAQVKAWKAKTYKGDKASGAAFEAAVAKVEGEARTLYGKLKDQFTDLGDDNFARGVVTHLENKKMARNVGLGIFDLNKRALADGDTFLHAACRHGRAEIVALLLQLGANPNVDNDRGATPLHLTLQALGAGDKPGAYACLWHLLERGADCEVKDFDRASPADIAAAQSPPFELWAVANVIALAHAEIPAAEIGAQIALPLPNKPVAPLLTPMPQSEIVRLGLKDFKAKQILEANRKREEEAAKKEQEEEAARLAAEEEAENKKDALKMKKTSKVLQANLTELFKDINKESAARSLVELLCAPVHVKVYRGKLVDLATPPPEEKAEGGLGRAPLHLAAFHFKPMLVDALLAADAAPSPVDAAGDTPLHIAVRKLLEAHAANDEAPATAEELAAQQAAKAAAAAEKEAAGEAAEDDGDDGATPIRLTVASAQDVVVRLLEAGADREAKNNAGESALSIAQSVPDLGAWLAGVEVSVLLFNERKKNSIMTGLLQLLEATRSAEEQARVVEAQARIEAKKRAVEERKAKALEEARRKEQEELTARLLAAAEAERKLAELEAERLAAEEAKRLKDERIEADLARLKAEEEETARRQQEEKAKAEAQLAAKLARGKKSAEEKLAEEALKQAEMLEAEKKRQEALANEEMQRKLAGRKKRDADESESERARREKTEAEEAAEDLEESKINDSAFDATFTMMDLAAAHPTAEQMAALHPHITSYTKGLMQRTHWEIKHHRAGAIGLDVTIVEVTAAKESVWEQVKDLDELIDASIAERKILTKNMTQANRYSKRKQREAKRRLQLLAVNAAIYEDLLNKIMRNPDNKKPLQQGAKEAGELDSLQKLRAKLAEMEKTRAIDEEAAIDAKYDPVLSQSGDGALLSTLLGLIRDPLLVMDAALGKLDEDTQLELPLDMRIEDKLTSAATKEWEALAYAKRQMSNTDALVRDLRGQKMGLEKQLEGDGGAALSDANRAEMEEMVADIAAQLAPLDVQHDMYTAIIAAINDHHKELFLTLPAEEQLAWEQKRKKEEAKLDEYFAKQAEEAQRALEARGKKPSKADLLMSRIMEDHKDDWETKRLEPRKSIIGQRDGARLEEFDDGDLDLDWMRNRFGDLTGIDQDIIDDLKLLTEDPAAHYLAIKLAENEADAAFTRQLQAKARQAALTAPEQLKLAEYSAYLDRRYPMFERLYAVLTTGPDAMAEAKYERFVDLDLERDYTKDLLLAKRIQAAKIDMLDWRDVREQCAAETFCAAMAKLGGALRPSYAVNAATGASEEDLALSEDVLTELHRGLHAQCCVSQDVVYMIINTTAGGKVTRANLVKSLHALHVACARDSNVYWDSQVMFPLYGGFGVLHRDQAELVFGFNDHDVKAAFFDKFVKTLQTVVEKNERAEIAAGARAFPYNIFSRRALGLGSNGSEFYAATSAEDAAEVAAAGITALPVERMSLTPGGDLFIGAEELVGSRRKDAVQDADGNVLKAGVEKAARLQVGYWDLRHHLVAEPDVALYNPTGWTY